MTAITLVERYAVEIVLDLCLVRVVGEFRHWLSVWIRFPGRGPRDDDVFTIGTPGGIGLDVGGIVSARKRLQFTRRPAVPGKDAARRKEDLKKTVIREVGNVVVSFQVFA